MCADKYKYLCSVRYESDLFAALVTDGHVCPGDLVVMDIGITGKVERVIFVDTTSDEYQMLSDLVHVDKVVEIYHKYWPTQKDNDGNS